jgi:3-hydroxyacyl-CoA dehydrogenase/enoyl-CoA hydratase/3-hydroxybutyryl-CoA epimerase
MGAITLHLGADGIAVATMDLPGRPENVVNDELMQSLAEVVERLEGDAAVKGLVLASAKPAFCAGGDIDRISRFETAQEVFDVAQAMKAVLRRLERTGKPVAAAIAGHALGGGLEIALACHRRIVVSDASIKLGQPEVKLGLLPGGGGTVRLPRLVGQQAALQLVAEGTELRPDKALALGVVHELAADAAQAIAKARAWCLANPKAAQPWDAPRFRFPGGDSRTPAALQLFSVAPSVASARTQGNHPAVTHILSCMFEGGLLDFDAAGTVESRYFAACAMTPESRNLIGTLWYQLNAIRKGRSRPDAPAGAPVRRLGVLGAGMMGAGIASVAARRGIDVVLLDTTQALADRGRDHASQGKGGDAAAERIRATTRYDDLNGCDLVIEAVFEDRAVKADVTARAEAVLGGGATVFASNTSTLPITGLAAASARPGRFIGLHFFSPVEKMPLVEIIVGDRTSDETLARAFDFVLQIGKTPIVVNDARGFYTSRVFATYVLEGAAMLKEGVHPRHIEAAGLQAGMPMPPLALQDEVSLSLAVHAADQARADFAADQARADFAAEGKPHTEHPGMAVLRQLCEVGRIGRKAGRGFYDWGDDGKRLWPELAQLFPPSAQQPPQRELVDRFLYAQANEAARCLEEGVVRSIADANVGSILGWGFAPFHGGTLQFINATGPAAFVERARELAARHGARFEPAGIVQRMAAQGAKFAD